MADFKTSSLSFHAASVTVAPVTAAAKAFFAEKLGAGVADATIPKSGFGKFLDAIEAAGLTYSEAA